MSKDLVVHRDGGFLLRESVFQLLLPAVWEQMPACFIHRPVKPGDVWVRTAADFLRCVHHSVSCHWLTFFLLSTAFPLG